MDDRNETSKLEDLTNNSKSSNSDLISLAGYIGTGAVIGTVLGLVTGGAAYLLTKNPAYAVMAMAFFGTSCPMTGLATYFSLKQEQENELQE
ncbi:MAG TPA: hypothetical protein VJA18_05180 [Candidatus Nanoarchaeia archaeon]|nr:hypothetical protein [Candidatus Nanoarchaeia archaeon]